MNRPTLLRIPFVIVALWATVSFSYRTLAQDAPSAAPTSGSKGTFRSDADDLLTVEKVSVFPFTDNIQGIYARPLEAHFIALIDKMHRWDYVPASSSGPILAPEELESSTEKTLQASQGLDADGFFVVRVSKGPNGVTIHMSMFLKKDGKLLSQAILKDYKQFDIGSLKEQVTHLLTEVVTRLPYSGRVLSREANRVTVNLGSRDGISPNQMLNVVQVIQAQRHPKFNFLIKTEREIFGKIKILKTDETLSFGVVVSERDKGAIQKNSKVGSVDFVTYGNSGSLSLTPTPEEALGLREDGKVAFGKDARAWQPQNPPSFGQVGGTLGFSRSSLNRQTSTVGSAESTDNFAPNVALLGEIWVTQEWTFHAKLKQAIIAIDNPVSGSTPGKLSQSLTYYEAAVGYTFRFGPHLWSSNVEPYFGLFYYRLYTDNSTPTVFTTMQFSGMKMGVRGSTPVSDDGVYGVGGDFSLANTPFFKPGVKETPAPSGDSATGTVVQFGIFGYKRMGERLKLQGALDFEMFSATFSPSGPNPATSASHRHLTLSGGVIYMF